MHRVTDAPPSDAQQRRGRYARLVPDSAEGLDVDAEQQGAQIDGQISTSQSAGIQNSQADGDSIPLGSAEQLSAVLKSWRIYTAWRLFDRIFPSKDCEALMNPHPNDHQLLNTGRVFAQLLEGTNTMYCRNPATVEITPTMALFKLEQIGVARSDFWTRRTLSYLTYRTIRAVNGLEPGTNLEYLLSELLSVWRLFFQFKGTKGMPLDSVSNEWNLPAAADLPHIFESRQFQDRLQDVHPGYISDSITGFCAVYLYTLSDALNASENLKQQAEPFIQVIGRLLAGSYVNKVFYHIKSSPQLSTLPEEVKQEITKEINGAPAKALRDLGMTGEAPGEKKEGDKAANLEAFFLKRMARAVKSREAAKQLDTLWQEALKDFKQGNDAAIPPRIYNAFLNGFIVLLRPQRSVEIWNHMIASGIEPDVQTWVALIEGCAKAKDSNGFDAMWTRMLNSGIEPDVYAWTARAHGLFSMRQIDRGLAALDEMGNRWLAAENASQTTTTKGVKKPSKGANNQPKPSIEVVNGAISALTQISPVALRHRKCIEFVQKILGWANAFQIKPDTITYNSLMRLYIREGDTRTAYSILQQMEREGLEADIATHNILITASFDNASFAQLSKPEQTEKVKSLFNALESSGLKLNEYVYSTAIDKLLKYHSNYEAVGELIAHMHARKLVPSAHVYTSLVTYYFQLDPPAIANIDAIVHQVFTSQRVPTDRILFDRILEGYAAAGEVNKMMDVLRRMANHGRLPSWGPLTAVIEALVNDGDLERARQVVRDVSRSEGIAKGGVTGGKTGEARFFATAKRFDLVEETMGEMWSADRAVKASADDAVLGEQLRAQEIEQIVQAEEAQDVDAGRESEHAEVSAGSPTTKHIIEDNENVHDFLRKDQKP